MKKVLIVTMTLVLLLTGCNKDISRKDVINYMEGKYDTEFTFSREDSGTAFDYTNRGMYLNTAEILDEIYVNVNYKTGKITDGYIAAKWQPFVRTKMIVEFQNVFDNFKIQCSSNEIVSSEDFSVNTTLDEFMLNKNSKIWISVLTDDEYSYDKLQNFEQVFKSNKIPISGQIIWCEDLNKVTWQNYNEYSAMKTEFEFEKIMRITNLWQE